MKVGDVCKYIPTSTVGKVTGVRERDGRVWACLDRTGLWYDVSVLSAADPSEYVEVAYKYREKTVDSAMESLERLKAEAQEIDISDMAATSGG
ncbi:MAG: DUF2098 domain-containing protein [Thermoplasmatales archaeon]|nr:DUF2098 domain-containing protein [Thermoplasmatales archaeon]